MIATNKNRGIILWLIVLMVMVFFMVFIGGVTRLTDSGLSIVDWKPIMGAIPPLSYEDWMLAFKKYQAYPEFQKINSHMALSDFKSIFFWEYFHRLFGRLIGIAFILPFAYFVFRGRMSKSLALRVLPAFLLGGLQGLMGWYMVKSGLVSRPDVSQYRLCAHLLLAFIIIGHLYFVIQTIRYPDRKFMKKAPLQRFIVFFFMLIFAQIFYGAFVAGLDAGLTHNTFPLMGGHFLPTDMFMLTPWWINFFENIVAVQFVHRCLGWMLFILAFVLYLKARKITNTTLRRSVSMLHLAICLQFIIGVMTLLLAVPISLASLHQLGAVVVFILSINTLFHSFYCVSKV